MTSVFRTLSLILLFSLLACGGGDGGGESQPATVEFLSTAPTRAQLGVEYSYAPQVTSGASLSVPFGSLPAWLSFQDNQLTGTPFTNGEWAITLIAMNEGGATAIQNFTIAVDQEPEITNANEAVPFEGVPYHQMYSYRPSFTGKPTPTLSLDSSLPDWLEFDGSTISGIPPSGQLVDFSIRVSNGVGSDDTHQVVFTPQFVTPDAPERDFEHVEISNATGAGIQDLSRSADGVYLASAGSTGQVEVWHIERAEVDRIIETGDEFCRALAFDPSGERIALAMDSGRIEIRALDDGALITGFAAHISEVLCIAWSTDGQWLASGGEDLDLHLWDASDFSLEQTARFQAGMPSDITFSPDSSRAAAVYEGDAMLRVWQISGWNLEHEIAAHIGATNALAFSPDSQRVATCGNDSIVRVWSVASGAELFASPTLDDQQGGSGSEEPSVLAYSPDGALLATGFRNDVWVLDAQTCAKRQKLHGHSGLIQGLAFSDDSQRLFSASGDQTIRFWRK